MLEGLQRFVNTSSQYDHRFLGRELRDWHGRVLDVGCGNTRLRSFLPPDGLYVGIDLNPRADIQVDISRQDFPFAANSFDYAICNAVLEHVEDHHHVVAETFRVLKSGGTALFSVPFLQPYHPDPVDYRRFTQPGLRRLLEGQGFIVDHDFHTSGTAVVMEYLAFFDLIKFWKQPRRLLNPLRYFHGLYLGIVYLLSKVFNLLINPLISGDTFASPGAMLIVKKP